MAFNGNNMTPIGGNARAGDNALDRNAPMGWGYQSKTDDLAAVLVTGYFDTFHLFLVAGQFIYVSLQDKKEIITVQSVDRVLKQVVIDPLPLGGGDNAHIPNAVVEVFTEADFGTAVGDVIALTPGVTYELMNNIFTDKRFDIAGSDILNSVGIRSNHRFSDGLYSTGSGDPFFFNSDPGGDVGLIIQNIFIASTFGLLGGRGFMNFKALTQINSFIQLDACTISGFYDGTDAASIISTRSVFENLIFLLENTTRWFNSNTVVLIDAILSVSGGSFNNLPETANTAFSISSKNSLVGSQTTLTQVAIPFNSMEVHSNLNPLSSLLINNLFSDPFSSGPSGVGVFFNDQTGTVSAVADGGGGSYSGNSFSVSIQDAFPAGMSFNNDGTKMFIAGGSQEALYEYDLITPFSLAAGVSYSGNSFSVSVQDSLPAGLVFNNDGTKMFVMGANNATVYEYDLTTPFSFASGVSYSGNSFSVNSQETFPMAVAFNNDGTRMFVVGPNSMAVHEYNLITPFSLASGVSSSGNSFSVNSEEANPEGMSFNDDGTKMFIVGAAEIVYEYDLITPFSLASGVSYSGHSFDVSSEEDVPKGVAFNNDGAKMFIVGSENGEVHEYDLTAPFSLSSGVICTAAGHNLLDGDTVVHDVDFTDVNYRGSFVVSEVIERVSYKVGAPFGLTDTGTWTNVSLTQKDPKIISSGNTRIALPNSMTVSSIRSTKLFVVNGPQGGFVPIVDSVAPQSGDYVIDVEERITTDDQSGLATHNGLTEIDVEVKYSFDFVPVGSPQILEFAIAKSGSLVSSSVLTFDSASASNVATIGTILRLAPGDTVGLIRNNTTNASDTNISNIRRLITSAG